MTFIYGFGKYGFFAGIGYLEGAQDIMIGVGRLGSGLGSLCGLERVRKPYGTHFLLNLTCTHLCFFDIFHSVHFQPTLGS